LGLALALVACQPGPRPQDDTPDDPEDPGTVCVTDDRFFTESIEPVLLTDCAACHHPEGQAQLTRLLVTPESDPDHTEKNRALTELLLTERWEGEPLLLAKPSAATPHGGGRRLAGDRLAAFQEWSNRVHAPGACEDPGPPADVCATEGPFDPGLAGLRRLSRQAYVNTVHSLLGEHILAGTHYPATEVEPGNYRTFAAMNPVSAAVVESMLIEAEAVGSQVQGDVTGATGCTPGDEDAEACFQSWVADFGARAFRRPLLPEERDVLLGVFDAGTTPAAGAGMVVETVLQAPQFVYLDAGLPEGSAGTIAALDSHQRAARLAYFLWQGPPDPLLREAAANGELITRAQVEAQARRMIEDPRVADTVASFHLDWAAAGRLLATSKDPDVYPDFDADTIDAMHTELRHFFVDEVWASGRFETVLTSPATWIDTRLEPIYGVDSGSTGPGDFRRVELDPVTRPGVLTRSGFLTGHAYTATSSPITRGMWVLEKLLCEHMELPPDVDATLNEEPGDEARTLRERLERHRADPACAGCHDRIDPVGFSLENYGAIGEYRTTYHTGQDVDSSGRLTQPDGTFDSAAGLLDTLQTTDRVRDCYATEWLTYGLGRPLTDDDICVVKDVRQRFAESEGDLKELLVAVATSDAFLHTRIPEED